MKILFVSYTFAPNLGGIETMSALLAGGFAAAGHEVRVVTHTPATGAEPARPYAVFRRPAARALWRLFRWCDLVVHSNITLRAVWPLLFARKPWAVIHHTWIVFPDQPVRWSMRAKLALLPAACSICVSRALARALPFPSFVIPNTYDPVRFARDPATPRDRDLLFVGRLVPDKGADLLLHALHRLRDAGLRPSLTLVGAGPAEASLRALATGLGLDDQVEFAGPQPAATVAAAMRRHRIVVVPSRWHEPFGVVALEAIASGCYVIGSSAGGLAEAIGPGGATFPNGDEPALAAALARAWPEPPPADTAAHLARHHPDRIVGDYLRVLERLLERAPACPP